MTVRRVLVEMDADDWGYTEAAAYVESRDMRGFMGTVKAVDIGPDVEVVPRDLLRRMAQLASWFNGQGEDWEMSPDEWAMVERWSE